MYASICPAKDRAPPCATRPPATARPHQGHPHTSALAVPAERTGAGAELGERGKASLGRAALYLRRQRVHRGVFSVFGNVRCPGSPLHQLQGNIKKQNSRYTNSMASAYGISLYIVVGFGHQSLGVAPGNKRTSVTPGVEWRDQISKLASFPF